MHSHDHAVGAGVGAVLGAVWCDVASLMLWATHVVTAVVSGLMVSCVLSLVRYLYGRLTRRKAT
jgi:hypothetical protein